MRRTIEQFRGVARELTIELRGMLRRVVIGATTSDRLWQFLGYEGIDQGEREPFTKTEVFQGVGFSSRPKAGQGEAIIAHIGGRAGHAVAIATRDRATEPGDLSEDETQMHTSKAQVRVKANGEVHVTDRSGGAAVPLATLADLEALKKIIQTWTPVPNDGGAALKAAMLGLFNGPPTWPAGTSKLKGQ